MFEDWWEDGIGRLSLAKTNNHRKKTTRSVNSLLEMVMVFPVVVDRAPAFCNASSISLGSADRGTPPRTRQVVPAGSEAAAKSGQRGSSLGWGEWRQ